MREPSIQPLICGSPNRLQVADLVQMARLQKVDDLVRIDQNCQLEAEHLGAHQSHVQTESPRGDGIDRAAEWWLVWTDTHRALELLSGCPATRPPNDEDLDSDSCLLAAKHPGRHGFQLDRRYSPAARRDLLAERIDACGATADEVAAALTLLKSADPVRASDLDSLSYVDAILLQVILEHWIVPAAEDVVVGAQITEGYVLHQLMPGTVIRDGDDLVGEIGCDPAGRLHVLWVGESGEYPLSEVVCSADHPVTILATGAP